MNATEEIIGRRAELSVIGSLLDGLPATGGALLLHGDPGIGKSTLLSAAEVEARRRGCAVLRTAGSEVEADLSFACLHRLLRPVLDHVGDLPRRLREALLVAFGAADGPPPERFLLALAALELLAAAAATRSLLVLVEDVHWLDRPSAEALAFVARRLEAEPIVLLAASRTGPERWPADESVPAVQLEPLGDDDAAALLGRSPAVRRAQQQRIMVLAAGNPLALVELPRALAGRTIHSGPAAPLGIPVTARLDRAFAARATDLSRATRSILLVTALEDGLTIGDALRAAGALDQGEVGEGDIEPAIEAGLLDAQEGLLRFRHPLMRSAIQAHEGLAARRAAHAALAVVLADRPERALWHRADACVTSDEALAGELAQGATVALDRGALAEATRRLERASRLSVDADKRVGWLLQAAELAAELNDRELVDGLLPQIEASALDVRGQARCERVRGRFARISDADEPRIRQLVALADACVAQGAPGLALDLLLAASLRCFWAQPSHAAREAVVGSAQAVGMPAGTPQLLAVLAVADPLGCGALVARCLAERGPAPVGAVEDARLLGLAAFAIGDFAAALRLTREAADGLRVEGRLGLLALTLIVSAWSAIVRGELELGLRAASEGRRLALESGQWSWAAAACNGLGIVLGLRGLTEEAERVVHEGAQLVDHPPVLLVGGMAAALGVAALGAGRTAEAYERFEQLMVPPDPSYPLREYQGILGYLVEAAVAEDRIEDVRRQAAAFGIALERDPAQADRPGEALALAVLADDDAAFAAALTAVSSPFERARIQLARGIRLRYDRRLVDSREPLRTARDTFDQLGVAPWAERARQQLRAAGESSATRQDRAWDALSPQEMEIARLAASGMSNKDIGRRLYLSHRTVGSHLYRLFPKLGVVSRGQLASRLPRDGDGAPPPP